MSESDDRYRKVLKLGEGGMAVVDLAVARGPSGFSKLVVLKALRDSLTKDEDMRRQFLSEARISARLNHPNIVQVNEIIEREGLPIIVMEYLEGQSLDQVLVRTKWDVPLALQVYVVSRVLRALEHAHDFVDLDGKRAEIVHRDVSPHNVFVTYTGDVKLLDFGVAVLAHAAREEEQGVLQGKIRYMAPEQVLSEPTDRRTDLFSLGVLLWECVAGRSLWDGFSEDEILNHLANGELPELPEREGVSPALRAVIARAVQCDPADRYQSAGEMQRDMLPIVQEFDGADEEALAKYMSELFADRRAEARREVARHLHDAGLGTLGADVGVLSATTRRAAPPKRRGALVGIVAGVAIAALAVAAVARSRPSSTAQNGPPAVTTDVTSLREPQRAQSTQAAQPEQRAGATVDAGPTQASLAITVFPERARVMLDGVRVSNPYNARLVADGREHTVSAEAAGYLAHTETFAIQGDVFRTIRLDPQPQAQPAVRARRLDAGATSAPARPNCDPPYYTDERGIRRYRAECL